YGLMLFVAFLACIAVTGRLAKRQGIAKPVVQDLAIWLFLGGLIGARTAHMLLEARFSNVWDFIGQFPRLWGGGGFFFGGASGRGIGFAVAYRLQLSKLKIPVWQAMDIVAPALALGLCLGRVGCLLNGCCYGDVSCPRCIGIQFPMSAPARFDMVHRG